MILKSFPSKERLPSKGNFYISLTDKNISDEDYEHVFKVWGKFRMKTVKDYHIFCFSMCLKNLEITAQKTIVYVLVIILVLLV